jgi:cytochrome P450
MEFADIPMLSGGVGLRGHVDEFERDRFAFLDRMGRELPGVGRVRFISRDILVVNSPSAIHEVLVEKARSFEKSPMIRIALYPLVGEGLFTSGGELWRKQRRLMAPVFHHAKIDALAPVMVDCATRVCGGFRDGEQLDVARETTRIAMSVAGRTLFGIDTFEESSALASALTTALEWANGATTSFPLVLQVELRLALLAMGARPAALRRHLERVLTRLEAPILWPTRRNRELRRAIAELDSLVQRMIDDRRAAGSASASDDLLSRLLDAQDEDDGGHMTDKQVRDEILTLFVAGHETTANGLAWSLYLLARHPQVYARARAAVDSLGGRAATLADLDRLEFLGRVFKEALRLYPPVYLFARISCAEVTVGGYRIPERTAVTLSPWIVQRNPELWPDPTRFDPERFTPAAEAARPSDAWIPFSDGPRVCIGAHFAQLEAPLVLATLLQRADFALADDREILPDESSTLRPRGGVPMRIALRSALPVSASAAP